MHSSISLAFYVVYWLFAWYPIFLSSTSKLFVTLNLKCMFCIKHEVEEKFSLTSLCIIEISPILNVIYDDAGSAFSNFLINVLYILFVYMMLYTFHFFIPRPVPCGILSSICHLLRSHITCLVLTSYCLSYILSDLGR